MVTVTTTVVTLTVKLSHYCVVNSIIVVTITTYSDVHSFGYTKVSHYVIQCSDDVIQHNENNFEFDQAAARIIFCKETFLLLWWFFFQKKAPNSKKRTNFTHGKGGELKAME